MDKMPVCPQCSSEYTYEDRGMFICPECANEWTAADTLADTTGSVVRDANGNVLTDGDSVSIIKDLKVKGSSTPLKIGTKVKNIRLVEGDHNIETKIRICKKTIITCFSFARRKRNVLFIIINRVKIRRSKNVIII